MKKKIAALTAGSLLMLIAFPVMAQGPEGPAGKSNMYHKNLMPFEESADYKMYMDSWARVTYNYSGESLDFVLNGHGLEPGEDYVVKSKGHVLGEGTANPAGELHINGSWEATEDLFDGRLNLRRAGDNERILWSGEEVYDVFDYIAS